MPYKILFARNSGKTFQVDFTPTYDQKGCLERTEPVPFRLTRNLHTFFTPFGVEGVFVSAMAAAAQASTPLFSATPTGFPPSVAMTMSRASDPMTLALCFSCHDMCAFFVADHS